MKSVLIVSREYEPEIGGVASAANTIKGFFNRNGIDATVVSYEPSNVFWPVLFYFRILKYLLRNKYDLVVINDVGGAICFPRLFLYRVQRSCYIFHGQEYEEIISAKSKIKRFAYQNVIGAIDSWFFASEFLKSKILKLLSNQYDSEIIKGKDNKTLYIGIPDGLISNENKSAPSKKITFVTCSRIIELKGHERLLRYFHFLKSNGVDFEWHIIGDYNNSFGVVLKNDMQVGDISQSIIWHGKLSKPEIVNVYKDCDIFILLSDYEESFGLVYLEASACGLPSVGNNLGGVKEAITDGVNGRLLEYGQSNEELHELILSIVTNYETYSRRSKEVARNFTSSSSLMKLLEH